MDNPKKSWATPELQIFGDIEDLTQQGQGRAKGQGINDSLNTNPANNNTGVLAS